MRQRQLQHFELFLQFGEITPRGDDVEVVKRRGQATPLGVVLYRAEVGEVDDAGVADAHQRGGKFQQVGGRRAAPLSPTSSCTVNTA